MIGKEGKSGRWAGGGGGGGVAAVGQVAAARRVRQRGTVVIRVCVDGTQSKIRG